jgi:hypothetical protein
MRSKSALWLVLVLVVGAAMALLWSNGATGAPADSPAATRANDLPATPDAGAVAVDSPANPATMVTATMEGAVERIGAAASASGAGSALVGRVVDADGKPLANARVIAAGPLAFANANGEFDLDSFDFGDLEEDDDMNPAAMLRSARAQLAKRVEAATDVDGKFRLVPAGTGRGVGLRVLATGHRWRDKRVARPTEGDVDLGELRLERAAVVRGRVVVAGGAPLAGALVRSVPAAEVKMMGGMEFDAPEIAAIEALRDGESARTDDDGRFALLHVVPGEVLLRVRHAEHPTTTKPAIEAAAGAELLDVLITMPRGTSIRGRVVGIPEDVTDLEVACAKKQKTAETPLGPMGMFGGEMMETLADMGMGIGDRKADVAADGSFELRGLAADTYRVWVTRAGDGFGSIQSARVEIAGGSHSVELRYEPGNSVTFRVVDAKTEQPVERLWVGNRMTGGGMMDFAGMRGGGAKVRDYAEGKVEVGNLRPKGKQKLALTVDATGYQRWQRDGIELPKGAPLDLGVVRLEPIPVVNVTVVDAATGQPVPRASVRLQNSPVAGQRFVEMAERMQGAGPDRSKTDRDGRCVLNRPKGETTRAVVEVAQFAEYRSESIALSGDGPIEHTARLARGGTIVVTVVDAEGAPVVGAAVDQRSPTERSDQHKTDSAGTLKLANAAAGTHRFKLGRDDGFFGMMRAGRGDKAVDEAAWQEVAVGEGGEVTLRLQQEPSAQLTGIVRDAGVPIADVRIAFLASSASAQDDAEAKAMERVADMMPMGQGSNRRGGKTDTSGAYQLADLPAGEHRLRLTHKRLAMTVVVPVTLRLGANTLDIELPTTVLRGIVRDPSGQPVAGARISVDTVREAADGNGAMMEAAFSSFLPGSSGGQRSDSSGAFELRGVPTGVPLQVSATAKGLAPASTTLTLDAAAPEGRCELQLEAAGKLKVTVSAEAPMTVVVARKIGGKSVPPVMQMLQKGKATLDGLAAGSWEVSYEGAGGDRSGNAEERKRTIEVKAGETVNVDF